MSTPETTEPAGSNPAVGGGQHKDAPASAAMRPASPETTARSREDIEARVRAAISRELDQLVGRGVSEPIEGIADRLLHAVMGALVRAGVGI